jgi:SAM-dependent methyltransferase
MCTANASAGYPKVTNTDVSEDAIKTCQTTFDADRTGLTFIQDDALNSNFTNASFDVILDKGCLDAICFFTEPKDFNVALFLQEVSRLLVENGRYLYITSTSHGEKCIPLLTAALGRLQSQQSSRQLLPSNSLGASEVLEISEGHVCSQHPEKIVMHVFRKRTRAPTATTSTRAAL